MRIAQRSSGADDTTIEHGRRSFRSRSHLLVNALWLGFQFQDAALFAIIMPVIVLRLVPQTHVESFAMLATISTAVGTITPTVAGWLSDRLKRTHVSRRIQTIVLVILDVLALVAIATSRSLPILTIAVGVAACALAAGETTYQAILPEVVPRRQWGISSGVRGALTLVGATVSLLLAGLLPPTVAVFCNAALLIAMAFSLIGIPPDLDAVHDQSQRPVAPDRRDLVITMILRGFMVLGLGLFTTYALYFFNDVLHVPNAPLRTGITAGAALVGAILSSIASGVVAHHIDRRYLVAGAGFAMAAAGLGFAINPDPNMLFVYSGVFGIGLGAVFSAGFALTLGSVPRATDFGRDLGIWATISGLPAIAAPLLGAYVLTRFHYGANGYRALFLIASISFALGAASTFLLRRQVVEKATDRTQIRKIPPSSPGC